MKKWEICTQLVRLAPHIPGSVKNLIFIMQNQFFGNASFEE
jgi:hypothetical protein